MHLWYGIKGTVDKKLSENLDRLKDTGYPFEVKIFTELGHGGLAGEHPDQFVKEVSESTLPTCLPLLHGQHAGGSKTGVLRHGSFRTTV